MVKFLKSGRGIGTETNPSQEDVLFSSVKRQLRECCQFCSIAYLQTSSLNRKVTETDQAQYYEIGLCLGEAPPSMVHKTPPPTKCI